MEDVEGGKGVDSVALFQTLVSLLSTQLLLKHPIKNALKCSTYKTYGRTW